MLRPLGSALLLATLAAGTAHAALTARAAARPVAAIETAAATGDQTTPRIATNGEIGLAAWIDHRDGGYAAYIARVRGDGELLDPLGVRIADLDSRLHAVVWNGTAFVVILDNRLVFVAPDLTVLAIKSFPLGPFFRFAAATPPPNVRYLFIDTSDGNAGAVAILDDSATVVARSTIWALDGLLSGDDYWAAAASDDGFLIVRFKYWSTPPSPSGYLAYDLSRDGRLLSANTVGLPPAVLNGQWLLGLGGGNDGFLFLMKSWTTSEVDAYALDPAGIYHGLSYQLQRPESDVWYIDTARPRVVREEGRWVAAWQTAHANAPSEEWLAEMPAGGNPEVRRLGTWDGLTKEIALAASGSQRFAITQVDRFRQGVATSDDLFVRAAPSLSDASPKLLASSGRLQTNAAIAAGANGYAVAWIEIAEDGYRAYVRRVSAAGTPQDVAALHAFSAPVVLGWGGELSLPRLRIASNSRQYIVGWLGPSGFVIRRLDAQSGAWIDAEPVPLPGHGAADLVSNGGPDALAVSLSADRHLMITRIPLAGGAPDAPDAAMAVSFGSIGPAIASDGNGYLVTWGDYEDCLNVDLCAAEDKRIFTVRLRGDGVPIDGAPRVVANGYDSLRAPRVVWTGDRYLVVWTSVDTQYNGTYLSPDGAALSYNGRILGYSGYDSPARVAAVAGRIVFLERAFDSAAGVWWQSVTIPAGSNLGLVGSTPPDILATAVNDWRYTELAVAVGADGALAIAFDRPDPAAGNTPRVFVQLFDVPAATPRRRAAPH